MTPNQKAAARHIEARQLAPTWRSARSLRRRAKALERHEQAQAARRARLHELTTKGATTEAEDAEAQALAVQLSWGNLSD